MVEQIAATKQLIEVAEKLGIFDSIKLKLVGSPIEARSQLAAVLAKLSKIYTAIDSELSDYLSVFFTGDPRDDSDNRRLLLGLEGGGSRTRLGEARGHC